MIKNTSKFTRKYSPPDLLNKDEIIIINGKRLKVINISSGNQYTRVTTKDGDFNIPNNILLELIKDNILITDKKD